MKSKIIVGTRGSKLALWQASYVAEELQKAVPALEIDIKIIKTTGDKILDVALSRIGDKILGSLKSTLSQKDSGIISCAHFLLER